MAKKKAAAPRRRRRKKAMSEPGTKRRRSTRRTGTRRRRSSRKGGLSEIFSPAGFKQAGIVNLWGIGGGMASNLIDRLLPEDASPILRGGVQLGSAMIVSAVFKKDHLASGMSGAYGYQLLNDLTGGMSEDWEDGDYADDDAMSEYPDALDEEGNPMFLAEDGEFYYLEEYDIAEDGAMFLAESGIPRMYPEYVQNP